MGMKGGSKEQWDPSVKVKHMQEEEEKNCDAWYSGSSTECRGREQGEQGEIRGGIEQHGAW